MSNATRYLLQQLAGPTLLALGALAGALWLSQSLRFVDLIVNRGLPVDSFIYLTLLLVPSLILVVIPFSAFIGTLAGYNKLSLDSELTIFKAAGLSDWQLTRAAITLGVLLTALSYLFSLYVMPAAYRHFRDLQFEIRNDFSAVAVQEGVFAELAPNLTIFVRARTSTGQLADILVHDRRNPTRSVTVIAEEGSLLKTPEGPVLLLRDGNYQENTTGSPLSVVYFDETTVDLADDTPAAIDRQRKPRERFVHELLFLSEEDRQSDNANVLIAEGHERLSWPLLSLALPLVGAVGVLRATAVRRNNTISLVLTAVAAAGVAALSLIALSLAKVNLALVPLLYAVPLGTVIICMIVLTRDGLIAKPATA